MRHKMPTNLILLCICNICLNIVCVCVCVCVCLCMCMCLCVCVFQGNVAFSSQGDRIASTQIEQMRSEHNCVRLLWVQRQCCKICCGRLRGFLLKWCSRDCHDVVYEPFTLLQFCRICHDGASGSMPYLHSNICCEGL